MIYIYDEDLGTTVTLEGYLEETMRKRNFNEITTIRGGMISEHSRGVKDLTLNITYITESEYKKLQDIFLYSNERLYIEDEDRGVPYNNYFIQGETLSLTEYEDFENQIYYYKGGITLYKR